MSAVHDPRCMTLTSTEFPEVCDCRTLRLLDEGGAFGGATWKGCEVPPRGWWCSREKGHEPPCAARHVSGRDWPDTRSTGQGTA